MVMFAAVSAILVLLAVAWWYMSVHISPVAAENEYQELAQEQINTYRLRLKELETLKSYEELDDNEYESSVKELKRQLLHDLKGQHKSDKNKQVSLFLPGLAFLVIFVGAFYYVNGESHKLEAWQQAVEKLPTLGERVLGGSGGNVTAKELQQVALGLRTQLFEHGDDAFSWFLLGRVMTGLNDLDGALGAFERSYRLDPNRVGTLMNYSQLLLMQQGRQGLTQAAVMLSKVLRMEPQNVDALLMVGYIAEQMQDFKQAQMSWQAVMELLPPGDERRNFVTQKLAAFPNANSGANVQADSQSAQASAGNGASVNVRLTLDESVMDKVPQGATLFVYAKAPKGRPMPAAVVKLSRFDLPMTIELSDGNAMLPDYKLSSLEEVVIFGRISKDGDIAVSSGELQGQTPVFSLDGTKEVSLVINQIL